MRIQIYEWIKGPTVPVDWKHIVETHKKMCPQYLSTPIHKYFGACGIIMTLPFPAWRKHVLIPNVHVVQQSILISTVDR